MKNISRAVILLIVKTPFFRIITFYIAMLFLFKYIFLGKGRREYKYH